MVSAVYVLPSTVRVHRQWMFSPDSLLRTPSSEDGMPLDQELLGRQEACNIAARVGLSVNPPGPSMVDSHLVVAGAAAYVHRFYMRASLKEYDPWDIGPVCLFIASKDAERAMRMSTVANVTVRKKRKRDSRTNEEPNVDSKDPEVVSLIKTLLGLEEIVASTVAWEFIPALPYQPFSLGLRRMIAQIQDPDEQLLFNCNQAGWGFLNDSVPTPLVVLQPPSVIAAAAYVFTASAHGLETIETLLDTFHDWKRHFGLGEDVDEAEVKDRDDVEECLLWMAYYQSQTRHRPNFADYRSRRPRPFPQPSTDRSTLPSPSRANLLPAPATATPTGARSPASLSRSPYEAPPPPPSNPYSSTPLNGRNPYEPVPPDINGGGPTGMDVDVPLVKTNGTH